MKPTRSAELVMAIRRLWPANEMGMIADRLGVTKGIVAGHIHRQGWHKSQRPSYARHSQDRSRRTPEVEATIRRMRAEGHSFVEIGRATGFNRTTVGQWAAEIGCPRLTTATVGAARRRMEFSAERAGLVSRISELWATKTPKEIGADLGVSSHVVRGMANRMGLPAVRPKGTPRLSWSPARDAALRRLRDEGRSYAAVAKVMGIGTTTVLRRARELGILATEKPARTTPAWQPRKPLPPIPDLAPPPTPKPVIAAPAPEPMPPVPALSRDPCSWITGEKPWRYCDAPAVLGKPFCPTHCAAAYVRKAA